MTRGSPWAEGQTLQLGGPGSPGNGMEAGAARTQGAGKEGSWSPGRAGEGGFLEAPAAQSPSPVHQDLGLSSPASPSARSQRPPNGAQLSSHCGARPPHPRHRGTVPRVTENSVPSLSTKPYFSLALPSPGLTLCPARSLQHKPQPSPSQVPAPQLAPSF